MPLAPAAKSRFRSSRRWWRAGLALGCADAALIALEIAAAALVFMQCCAGGPSRDRGGGGRRPPAPIVEVAATAALPAEGVPPSIVLDGAPSPRRGSSLVPTQGVRTGYLVELETLARRLPYSTHSTAKMESISLPLLRKDF